MFDSIFPKDVLWQVAEEWMWEAPLCAEEEALVARAVQKRIREFRAGRNCAHKLFRQAGIQCNALLKGKQREPNWPDGWVGSISHTKGLCVVAIAPKNQYQSIGLDVEQATPLDPNVLSLICSNEEQNRIRQISQSGGQNLASVPYSKIIFSAKESIHKTYFPLNYHTLDFLDADVVLDINSGKFSATIHNPESTPRVPISDLEGRYTIDEKHVATFIAYT